MTISSDVLGTVFSSDSPFKLDRGVGTFKGSIIQKILSTRVRFTVQASVGPLSTDYTDSFVVQGKFLK